MKKIAFVLSFFVFVYACSSADSSSNNGDNNTSIDGFDRTALLTNWADNIIIPSYQNYQAKVQVMVTNANTFVATPTEANLQTLRTAWIDAYKAYQYVTIYGFGKSVDIHFKEATNTYPTDVTGIEANVTSGTYSLAAITQLGKQGLPAMDYMLNGLASDDTAIVEFYTTNAKASGYKKYLVDLASRLQSNVDVLVTDWTTNRNTYVNSNGSSSASSVNVTTNSFVRSFERDTRAEKVGYPAGIFSDGAVRPQDVEAFYKNDLSKDLLNISLQASQDFFNGKPFNSSETGPSLKSYLDFLNSTKNGEKLSDIMNNQYATAFSTNTALSNSFSEQINTDNSKMEASYSAMLELVALMKLDMIPAFKMKIDYVDNDGD